MKQIAKHKLVSTLAIGLCIGIFVFQQKSPTAELCQAVSQSDKPQPMVLASFCKPSQQSWFSWLQGNSRSTQFHFVDLLELLNRFNHRG